MVTFTERQKEALDKAINDGYLNGMVDDGVLLWLKYVNPRTIYDATIIMEDVFGLAYTRGVRVDGLWGERLENERERMRKELADMAREYSK